MPRRGANRSRARTGSPSTARPRKHAKPAPDADWPMDSLELYALRARNASLKKKLRHLEDLRDLYLDMYDFAPVTYVILDRNGIVLHINLGGCRILGFNRRELLDRPFMGLVLPDDRSRFLEHMRRCRTDSEIIESSVRLRTREGDVLTVVLHTTQSDHRGKTIYRTIVTDLTERLTLEEARRHAEEERARAERDEQIARASSEAKDRFIAMLSHELRTPLTPALFAAVCLMNRNDLPPAAAQLVGTIRRNIELEARLIDDLLDVTRISRGKFKLARVVVDLHDILRESLEVCAIDAQAKQIQIDADLSADSRRVDGDPTRLEQVFWNLLNNAIRFTPQGSQISVRTANGRASTVRVTVTDSGPGIDPAIADRLFRAFEQTGASRGDGGLGLGLAICKGIVEAHGGRISVESHPGKGATFVVELDTVARPLDVEPRASATAVDAAVHASVPETPVIENVKSEALGRQVPDSSVAGASRKLRVLIVEDDPDTGLMMSVLLSREGHDVVLVRTFRAAMQRIDDPWDVVISDIRLPDGSGLDVGRSFRGRPNRPSKLIALTGYGTMHDASASQAAGFDVHLVKPLEVNVLLTILRELDVAGVGS